MRIAGLALAALAIFTLVSLGNWQVRRLHWKEALMASVEARLDQAALPLADVSQLPESEREYRPVTVTGRFEHDRERHFFATYEGRSGYYIYTPLRLDDGRAIFVNRGFVPFDEKEPVTRQQGQVEGVVTITGLARNRLSGKPSFAVPENDIAKNIFYWKDLDAMAQSAGLSGSAVVPFFIDADDAPNPGGLPVGGVTRISFPNDHLQYALTWYGLAATLVVIVGLMVWRGRRRSDA